MSSTASPDVLKALRQGSLAMRGEFVWGSNYTFLVQVAIDGLETQGVYKPTRGARPLWDFPPASLARREVAAYLLSEALGWGLVPPTVYRKDGPLGPGSLQLFVEHNPEVHYFNFSQADRERLRPTALFDLLINNADRKGSHVLLDPNQRLWLIDHGICFHVEDKLRTVVWDFAGQPIPDELIKDLAHLIELLEVARAEAQPNSPASTPPGLFGSLKPFLSAAEISALRRRASQLLMSGTFPNQDPSKRQTPWPPV